jgi:hypothetical protein
MDNSARKRARTCDSEEDAMRSQLTSGLALSRLFMQAVPEDEYAKGTARVDNVLLDLPGSADGMCSVFNPWEPR